MSLRRKFSRLLPYVCLFEALVLVMIVMPTPTLANHAHFLNYDAVKNGRIFYDDEMDRYHQSLKYADGEWSAEGSVKIRKTPKNKKPTLVVRTYAAPSGFCGDYNPDVSPDRIQINRAAVENDRCGSNAPDSLILHEMGHALRIYDHTTGDYFYTVMYVSMVRTSGDLVVQCPKTLTFHDRHDFHEQWG